MHGYVRNNITISNGLLRSSFLHRGVKITAYICYTVLIISLLPFLVLINDKSFLKNKQTVFVSLKKVKKQL